MGVSGISMTNSLSLGGITPAVTTPVKPVSRVKSTTDKALIAVHEPDNKVSDSYTNMLKSYSSLDSLSYNDNPYDTSKKSLDYSIVSGMNFDMTA